MSLKDILVHMDSNKPCEARLDTALRLATDHQAHLVGLYIIKRPYIPPYVDAQISEEVWQAQAATLGQMADEAEAMFRPKAEKAGVSYEWRRVEGGKGEAIQVHARYSDLAVLGQRDSDGNSGADMEDMADRLVLTLGRPVLLVPYVGAYENLGQRVMIAWDGSRSATRAVHDALPILEKAKKVTVLAANPNSDPSRHGDIPGADISLHLARHGIKVEAQRLTANDISVGDLLLSRAADDGIDLLVMGAYGHSRWRELVLGGVTRHMMDHMTMPVLMSH